ncbi:Macrophage mannose receptor 1 [Varanus komodoensis]|nr:Macrophage mannose receptor 1 [Varanus komodoensis]
MTLPSISGRNSLRFAQIRQKIAQIRHKLDSTSESEASGEIPMSLSGPKLMDEFQLLRPDDVDKVLGQVRPTTCLLDPCPSWLINNAKHGIGTWILEVVNASLREGPVPAPLKEVVVRLVLKKASLDPEMATNYRPVANIPFLGKVLEQVVARQLQALLDETDYLDPLVWAPESSISKNNQVDSYFIGLQVSLDKKVSWMDGTPVQYVAWAPHEPNFANNDENCVVIYKNTGLWNDINCGYPTPFICERHNNSVNATVAPTPVPVRGGCPDSWLLFENKCYKMFGFKAEDQKTWDAARTACQGSEDGGNLATIPNEKVQAFLTYHLNNLPMDAWIGLNDINQEQMYLWTDGSGLHYTNWADGFPLTGYEGDRDDCVAIKIRPSKEAGTWRHFRCSSSKSYICQANTNPKYSLPPSTTPAPRIRYNNSSYFFIETKMTWKDAQLICQRQNSDLASILDPFSQSLLWLQVSKYKSPLWIGLNSNVTDGQYTWIDKFKFKYTNWASGEPKQNFGCVYLDLDGMWKTGSCEQKYFPLCKHSDGASLVSVSDAAEAHFLTENLEPLESKAPTFWIGMYKNLKGPKRREGTPEPTSNKAAAVVIVVILIISGAALAGFYFYRKRNRQILTDDNFENSLYFNSGSSSGISDTKDLVMNMEQNEHATI